jgi:hypothetical protein
MLKIVTAGVTALFVTAAPLAYAEQAASHDRLTAAVTSGGTRVLIEKTLIQNETQKHFSAPRWTLFILWTQLFY